MDKGFTQLLKKGIPFHWEQVSQASFDVVKDKLVQESLMYPPNFQCDYFLYIASADTTIAMVLVQVENGIENLIYYLSHNLNYTKVKYSYIENLVLVAVQVVQRFHHVSEDYCYFGLQPHDLYLITSISGGQVFKMDCHFTGI